jgi:flagellar basal-body rod protein FlgB
MIEALFNQTNYVASKKLLDGTVARHAAIASNLANVETPGYKRIDVNPAFQAELQQAIRSKDVSSIPTLQPTIAQDLSAMAANRDGNTVKLEDELLQMNQNTLAHTLETQLITGQLLKLRLAITGRG